MIISTYLDSNRSVVNGEVVLKADQLCEGLQGSQSTPHRLKIEKEREN